MSAAMVGTVQSYTVIRVPDKAHAAMAPFILLLVQLGDGKRVLGHFDSGEMPAIGSRVTATPAENETMVFRILEETS